MKNKFFKLGLVLTLIAVLLGCFASCGTGTPSANDASGEWNGFAWEYKKDTKKLTVTGSGQMPSATAAADVKWASIRASVESVELATKDGAPITAVGDYAFFGMSNLKSVSLPSGLLTLGKLSFGFCTKLESISLPETLTTVGDSAFEGCTALKTVKVPASVTALGGRAFAFCSSLEEAVIAGSPESVAKWTFKGCGALTKLTMPAGYPSEKIDSAALEGAGVTSPVFSENPENIASVIIKFVDENGTELKESTAATGTVGTEFVANSVIIDGYTVKGELSQTKTLSSDTEVFTFVYTKIEATEPTVDTPAETEPTADEGEKSHVGTIVALVIFGVVIIGICVGAFMLMRSDKKQKTNGSTVRKNAPNKNAKSDKNTKRKK